MRGSGSHWEFVYPKVAVPLANYGRHDLEKGECSRRMASPEWQSVPPNIRRRRMCGELREERSMVGSGVIVGKNGTVGSGRARKSPRWWRDVDCGNISSWTCRVHLFLHVLFVDLKGSRPGWWCRSLCLGWGSSVSILLPWSRAGGSNLLLINLYLTPPYSSAGPVPLAASILSQFTRPGALRLTLLSPVPVCWPQSDTEPHSTSLAGVSPINVASASLNSFGMPALTSCSHSVIRLDMLGRDDVGFGCRRRCTCWADWSCWILDWMCWRDMWLMCSRSVGGPPYIDREDSHKPLCYLQSVSWLGSIPKGRDRCHW